MKQSTAHLFLLHNHPFTEEFNVKPANHAKFLLDSLPCFSASGAVFCPQTKMRTFSQ